MEGAFPDAKVERIESSGGAFEIAIDGRAIYSKLESGRFPAYQEIPELIVKA